MKKGTVKKIIAILLAVILALGGIVYWSSGKKARILKGEWTTDMNMTDAFLEELEAEQLPLNNLSEMNLIVKMYLTFGEDGILEMWADEESWNEAYAELKENLIAYIKEYLEGLIEAENVDMTLEQVIAISGLSIEDLVDESMKSFRREDFSFKYKYKVKDDYLYLAPEGEELPKELNTSVNDRLYIYINGKSRVQFACYGIYSDPYYLFSMFEKIDKIK